MLAIYNVLGTKICIIRTLEVEDITKIMKVATIVGDSKWSWTKGCKRLLEYDMRVYEAKFKNKHRTRKTVQQEGTRNHFIYEI